jgi:hypothetical protein
MGNCARAARVLGFVLILDLSVCICPVQSASGQSSGNALASLRVSVASNVGRGCGEGIVPTAVREAAAARLAYVGITVSNIHNARLSMDLDCVAPPPARRNKAMAVQECLTFSEFVSAPSNEARPMLTSTWRRCRSYTCDLKCEVSKRYGAQLMGEFLGDLWERNPTDRMSPQQSRSESENRAAAQQSISSQSTRVMASSNPLQDTSPPGITARIVIFGGYILTCISVLVYWQFRNRGSWY